MNVRALLLFLAALALTGCVAIREPWIEPKTVDGETTLGPGYLSKKQTIEVEGAFVDGRFEASRIEIEEPDDELEVKAEIAAGDRDSVRVGDVIFEIGPDSEFVDTDGSTLELDALSTAVGRWAKAEGIERDGRLQLRKVTLRDRLDDELEELQGVIDQVGKRRRKLTVGPVDVILGAGVPIVWDVSGQEPPALEERSLVTRGRRGPRRINRIDEDDRRPDDQLVIDDFITVGGEIQYQGEWRKNHDLRRDRYRDRMVHTASAKVELSFDFSDQVFAFMKHKISHDIVIFDERDRLESGHLEYALEEAFVLLTDVPAPGFGVQIGRQDFDHGREWVMDDEIDAVRAYLSTTAGLFEFSISKVTFKADPEEEGILNVIAAAHLEPADEIELFTYFVHRSGGRLIDLDRYHFGASLEARVDDLTLWLDVGAVAGEEDDANVLGWGVDFAAMYVFEKAFLQPSIVVGFAMGSGDRGGRTDNAFRQTGLHDNNDRFNGVTSFRYLGELLRPELSNIMVFTGGAGLRHGRTSLDLVFHEYRQVEPAPFLRDSRLRLSPTGDSRDLGREIDIIVGLEQWRPLEIEVVIAWFFPGHAFPRSTGDAWHFTFQVEWNF